MMRPVRISSIALVALAAAVSPPDAAAPPPAEPTSPPAAVATPVAGATFDGDAALPIHADDVADYTLRATLDPTLHTVHGEGTITWRNTSSVPVREMWLHLYLNAFKN